MYIGLNVPCLGAHQAKWWSPGMFWVRGLLSWAVVWLHLLCHVLGCYMSMTWSSGLHWGYTGCHGWRHRGDLWDSWCEGTPVVCGCGCKKACRLVHAVPRAGNPALKWSTFDWKVENKYQEMCSFEIEIKNIFLTNSYNMQKSKKVLIILNWLDVSCWL